MKTLITGVAGAGKSTISKELNKRGIFSIDFSDVSGLCFWRNKSTREKVEYLPINDPSWFATNGRICDKNRLKAILDQHEKIVMTGIASGNQTEYLDLFDKVILLQCKPKTLIERMINREKSYGKTKVEQEMVVEWQKELVSELLRYGAIPVSTEGDVEEVMNKITDILN